MVTTVLYAQENQLGERLNDLDGVSKRVDLPEPDHTTNIDFITSEAVEEANERELEEGASDSHVQRKRIDLQEPDHSTNNNSFTSESLMIQGRSLIICLTIIHLCASLLPFDPHTNVMFKNFK